MFNKTGSRVTEHHFDRNEIDLISTGFQRLPIPDQLPLLLSRTHSQVNEITQLFRTTHGPIVANGSFAQDRTGELYSAIFLC